MRCDACNAHGVDMSCMQYTLMYTKDMDVGNREWRDVCERVYAIHFVLMCATYTKDIDVYAFKNILMCMH